MKFAVISDIHANLPALQAVLRDAEGAGCDRTVCLGDVVGFGAQPHECVEIFCRLDIPCVKGNFDSYCSDEEPVSGFNPTAWERIEWTRNQLNAEDKAWLRSLPYIREVEGFTIVHATLDSPARWHYVFDKVAAAASFAHQKRPVCFFGHTHVPLCFVRDGGHVRGGTFERVMVRHGSAFLINPGSVGQPRDGTRGASYATFDLDKQEVEHRRVDYYGQTEGPTGAVPAPRV